MTTRAAARAKNVSVTSAAVEGASRSTRSRAATSTTNTRAAPQATAKKTTARKPPANKAIENEPEYQSKHHSKSASQKAAKPIDLSAITEREPIMAYLRIRPRLNDHDIATLPYLAPLSETTVRMSDPQESQNNLPVYRNSTIPPTSIYTFSHVFPPNSTQSDFFTKTTLPLVRDVLLGQSGLLFTYGVTNSGKTYTVQGGTVSGSAGILPRTLDVLFNSIEGLHGEGRYRPVRLYGVEAADPSDLSPTEITPIPAIAEVLGHDIDTATPDVDIDTTAIPVDRNYEYTVWLSYAEVYNEKIYDLLESVKENNTNTVAESAGIPLRKSLLLRRKALALKSSPVSDAVDSGATGKYIAGLKQFCVQSAAQAKTLMKLGQLHRRVFGTVANRESSRSHGMVIIKVMRGHKGDKDDPSSLQTARLTLVDLAGSERTKHTQTTGERLKEAGNINKSLMVLGQCMEVMRNNQRKLASSLSQAIRMDTKDVKKGLAVVPFRHSKLTEVLMDYFTGDGRTVMIVNVNPFDTGYDENSHVMKFAALAREVYISPVPAPVQRMPAFPTLNPTKTQSNKTAALKDHDVNETYQRRRVTLTMSNPGKVRKTSQAIIEVLEEDEPKDDESNDDDEPINPLVDALFDEVERLRMQLYEAEMRRAIIEAETREDVMREMEDRMKSMEAIHSRRLMSELERHELKTDAKIDMLHQSGLFASPMKQFTILPPVPEDEQDEDYVEQDLIMSERADLDECENDDLSSTGHDTLSPLTGKSKGDNLSAHVQAQRNVATEHDFNRLDTSFESDGDDQGEDDVEWAPPGVNASKQGASGNGQRASGAVKPNRPKSSGKGRFSKLEQEMNDLTLQAEADESVIIIPAKNQSRQISKGNTDFDEDSEDVRPAGPKKKKRLLGKKPIITEDEIERVAGAVDNKVSGNVPPRRFRSSGARW
ncbi:hypothetical protein APHAL10511_006477 [Amanita phalloides]|nr:hypothetical protein APHAL10511_006477 [Amanita phalloides]